jgi:hypothetical protein
VFLPVPDADYVYCSDPLSGFPLAPRWYIDFCHEVWEVVHTASTWREFADRLTAIDSGFAESLFPDGVDQFLSDAELARADEFGGWQAIEDDIGLSFPMGGGTDPYRTWDEDLPDELLALCNYGSTMVSDYCDLDPKQLPEALKIIQKRGESAIDDCALLDELGWLFRGGRPSSDAG